MKMMKLTKWISGAALMALAAMPAAAQSAKMKLPAANAGASADINTGLNAGPQFRYVKCADSLGLQQRFLSYQILVMGAVQGDVISLDLPRPIEQTEFEGYQGPVDIDKAMKIVVDRQPTTLNITVAGNGEGKQTTGKDEWIDLGTYTYVISGNIAGGYMPANPTFIKGSTGELVRPSVQRLVSADELFSQGQEKSGGKEEGNGNGIKTEDLKNTTLGSTLPATADIDISVYPNPATEEIHIGLPQGIVISDVIIAGLDGKKWSGDNGNTSTSTLSVRHMPNGAYVLQVLDTDGKVHTAKFLKN